MKTKQEYKWPKKIPELTADQIRIKNDFMILWHEVLPRKFRMIEKFNHGYSIKSARRSGKILEIGCGLGEHIGYEDLNNNEYYGIELRSDMAKLAQARFPSAHIRVQDCQQRLPFPDHYFDRIVAIHVLEHLPNLPAAIKEVHRLLKEDGEFIVVIPCEGGLAYSIARRISAQRIFEKRYRQNYDWFIKTEHINNPQEILSELKLYFCVESQSFYPFLFHIVHMNLVIGIRLLPI